MTDYPNVEMRAKVCERIEILSAAIRQLDSAQRHATAAGKFIGQAWEGFGEGNSYYDQKADAAKGAAAILTLVREAAMADLHAATEQLASLLVRDVIAVAARTSDEPVVWITSNRYMPPLRDLGEAEIVYQADMDGTVWEGFMEALDRKLAEHKILMECPEYDNMLYVVDLNRFEHVERDESCDSLQDEWQRISIDN